MKTAWAILIISALTDFILTFSTGLATALAATKALPDYPTLLLAVLGGVAVAARTIQQALKATAANSAELKGQAPPIVVPPTATEPMIIKEQVKP